MVKNDVYSFGSVLLEFITGEQLASKNPKILKDLEILVNQGIGTKSNKKQLQKIMDSCLQGSSYPLEGAFKCVELALRCVGKQRENKPSRDEIVQILNEIKGKPKLERLPGIKRSQIER